MLETLRADLRESEDLAFETEGEEKKEESQEMIVSNAFSIFFFIMTTQVGFLAAYLSESYCWSAYV